VITGKTRGAPMKAVVFGGGYGADMGVGMRVVTSGVIGAGVGG